jgi:hypothetical protein
MKFKRRKVKGMLVIQLLESPLGKTRRFELAKAKKSSKKSK